MGEDAQVHRQRQVEVARQRAEHLAVTGEGGRGCEQRDEYGEEKEECGNRATARARAANGT